MKNFEQNGKDNHSKMKLKIVYIIKIFDMMVPFMNIYKQISLFIDNYLIQKFEIWALVIFNFQWFRLKDENKCNSSTKCSQRFKKMLNFRLSTSRFLRVSIDYLILLKFYTKIILFIPNSSRQIEWCIESTRQVLNLKFNQLYYC